MKRMIAITRPEFFANEAEILNQLFDEGLPCLHLRKPEASRQDIEKLLQLIQVPYYSRIILHDQLDLAISYPIGGIHLNRRNPEVLLSGFTGSVSRSCHALEELAQHKELDYLFLSPIFPSISKTGYGAGFPLEQLKQATEEGVIDQRIIALGGMDTYTIPKLKGLGFGGVAVLGALWEKNPSCETVIAHYHSLKKAIEKL